MSDEQRTFYVLGAALAIGLLIGIERGWKERGKREGGRVAGVRTYGLIGLLGGASTLLSQQFGPIFLGLALIAVSGALTTAYVMNLRRPDNDVGITSLITGILTFVLGGLAAIGNVTTAAAFAVIITLLLSYKPVLHQWLTRLEAYELHAGIQLLLVSVVLLPVLPDQGYGPWDSLNPYTIWWMVVLIAAISFVGYFATKLGGTRQGTVFTGLFGGLASSTALTLHYSRISVRDTTLAPTLATGILLACGTMYPRILFVASLINPTLFAVLLLPMTLMALITYLPALAYWRIKTPENTGVSSALKNPLELKTALAFGVFLSVVMLLTKGLQSRYGEPGVIGLAAASGLADVDAITLSLAHMSQRGLLLHSAATGIVLAAAVNSMVKGGMASVIGGRKLGLWAGIPLAGSVIGGLASIWFWLR